MTQPSEKPTLPPIHIDVFGSQGAAPALARFGVGGETIADIERATEARRQQKPGDAER